MQLNLLLNIHILLYVYIIYYENIEQYQLKLIIIFNLHYNFTFIRFTYELETFQVFVINENSTKINITNTIFIRFCKIGYYKNIKINMYVKEVCYI